MFSSAQRSAPQSTSHLANARGYGSSSQPARYIVRDLALARKGDLTAIKTSKVVSATVVTKP